jgi:hypothetical protein
MPSWVKHIKLLELAGTQSAVWQKPLVERSMMVAMTTSGVDLACSCVREKFLNSCVTEGEGEDTQNN